MNWNNVKAIFVTRLSVVPTEMYVATCLMHWYQQKGENLQEFNFKFSKRIQSVSHHEPKDIKDPLKYIYVLTEMI